MIPHVAQTLFRRRGWVGRNFTCSPNHH